MKVYEVRIRRTIDHPFQDKLVNSQSKRIICKAGRRGAKTVGLGKRAILRFLSGRRVLYAAPTSEQTDAFWFEIERAFAEHIHAKALKIDRAERFIEVPGTKQRIKAKTAWNADTLRGDFADDLLFDEYQLMNENAWEVVGAPMLMDNNGDAVFCFTPPSLVSAGVSKALDPRHASKFFNKALQDETGLWECLHWTSHDNPYISKEGLALASKDMSLDSYRREIMAEDDDIESSWLVYSNFRESKCKIPRFIVPKDWPVYTSHDFGSANPAALFASKVKSDPSKVEGAPKNLRYNDLVIWGEYFPGSKSTAQHVDEFKRITRDFTVARSTGGNQNTEDEIRQGYAAHGWVIYPPSIEHVNPQIDRVKGMMELDKIYVMDDLTGLLSQLANGMWVLDKENHITNKVKNEAQLHFLACLRYLPANIDFIPETVIPKGELTKVNAFWRK